MNTEIKKLENFVLGVNLEIVVHENEPYFLGKETASSLGFKNSRDAIDRHVDKEDKLTLKQLFQGRRDSRLPFIFLNFQPEKVVINEYGFYGLCLKSNLPNIKPFRRWVYETIKNIRLGNVISLQNLSLEDNPVAQIKETFSKIPPFESKPEREERKRMHEAYKEGFDESKDEDAVGRGGPGGTKTQDNIRKLKTFIRNIYFRSWEMEKDVESMEKFLEDMKKESKEIVDDQDLLKIKNKMCYKTRDIDDLNNIEDLYRNDNLFLEPIGKTVKFQNLKIEFHINNNKEEICFTKWFSYDRGKTIIFCIKEMVKFLYRWNVNKTGHFVVCVESK